MGGGDDPFPNPAATKTEPETPTSTQQCADYADITCICRCTQGGGGDGAAAAAAAAAAAETVAAVLRYDTCAEHTYRHDTAEAQSI